MNVGCIAQTHVSLDFSKNKQHGLVLEEPNEKSFFFFKSLPFD